LPKPEHHYLRSENVASDHSVGSDFYDGQIECIFTEPTQETKLFSARSEFIESSFKRFGTKIAHLDEEVIRLALNFDAPVMDTEKERRHVIDTLNKIYIESFDSGGLGTVLRNSGGDPKGLGSLKRLQAILKFIGTDDVAANLLAPFFVLYHLRVGYSHLTSSETTHDIFKAATGRLAIPNDSALLVVYRHLLQELTHSFERLAELVRA
jgi:hypothetical protein